MGGPDRQVTLVSHALCAFFALGLVAFTLPEWAMLSIIGLTIVGMIERHRHADPAPAWPGTERSRYAFPILSACFMSVFFLKLLSSLWALNPPRAIDNAFNHVHMLLWPLIAIAAARARSFDLQRFRLVVAASIWPLLLWLLVARIAFPDSTDATCLKAGAHNCGLLGQVIALHLLWLMLFASAPELSRRDRLLLAASLVAGILVFVATGRRTEWLGLLLAALAIGTWRSLQARGRRQRIGWVIGAVVGCAALLLTVGLHRHGDRLGEFARDTAAYAKGSGARTAVIEGSVGARLEMYRIGLLAFEARPLLGYGAGVRPGSFPELMHEGMTPFGYSNFHSQVLQIALETGVLGLTVSLIVLAISLRHLVVDPWRSGSPEHAALAAAVFINYLWKSIANVSIGYSISNSWLVVSTAVLWGIHSRGKAYA